MTSAEAVGSTALTNTQQQSCFYYYSEHLLVILFLGVWEYTIRDMAVCLTVSQKLCLGARNSHKEVN